MIRRLAPALVAVVVSLVPAGPATAAPGLKVGVTDDAWLEFGPGTLEERVASLDTLGVQTVRVTLDWREIEARQGVLDWNRDGALLDALRVAEIMPVVALWGTPGWANGGAGPNVPPRSCVRWHRASPRCRPWRISDTTPKSSRTSSTAIPAATISR